LDEIGIVRAWHEALNRGDADAIVALSHEDIEVGGPRGTGHGSALLRDWVARAGIQLEPLRWFPRGGDVVVEERARWQSPDSGKLGEPITLASAFHVADGRVRSVIRYESVEAALAATGLGPDDEETKPR
jgi:hypothetical protein